MLLYSDIMGSILKCFIVTFVLVTIQTEHAKANQNQSQENNLIAEFEKLIQFNEDTINEKSNKVLNLYNSITSKNQTMNQTIDQAVEEYFLPFVALFNRTLSYFPIYKVDLTRYTSLLSKVKTEVLKNITRIFTDILGTAGVTEEVSNIIKNMKEKFTDKYLKERCHQYELSENYSTCIVDLLAYLRNKIKNTHKSLDNVYNQTMELNSLLNINTSLANVFNSTLHQAVDIFTQSFWSLITATNVRMGNTYNTLDDKIKNYKTTAKNLLKNAIEKMKLAMNFAEQLGPFLGKEYLYNYVVNSDRIMTSLLDKAEIDFNVDLYFAKYIFSINVNEINTALKACTSKQNYKEQTVYTCCEKIINVFDLYRLDITLHSNMSHIEDKINFDAYIDQLENKFAYQMYEFIKNTTNDETFLAVVESYIKNVLNENEYLSNDVDKINQALDFGQLSLNRATKFSINIGKATSALNVAVEVASMFNNSATLGSHTRILNNLYSDALFITESTIYSIINRDGGYKLETIKLQLDDILSEFTKIKAEINATWIKTKCKNESNNKRIIISCVENIFKDYKNNSGNLSQKLNDLYKTANQFRLSILPEINPNLIDALKPIARVSDIASNVIFKNFNVTSNQIWKYALYDSIYNDIKNKIEDFTSKLTKIAEEIDRYTLIEKNDKIDSIFRAGTPIYNIVGVGRYICDTDKANRLLNETTHMVTTAIKTTLLNSPDNLPNYHSKYILNLANFINSSLVFQLSLVEEEALKLLCPTSLVVNGKMQYLHDCFKTHINKLHSYYYSQSRLLQYYEKDAIRARNVEYLKDIKYLRDRFVDPAINQIKTKAQKDAENFYRNCNINKHHMIMFSLSTAHSHYYLFQQQITNNVTAIYDLLESINIEMYKSNDIQSRLQSAATFVYRAIEVFLNSRNVSLNYELIKYSSETLIKDNVDDYNTFLSNQTNNIIQNHYKRRSKTVLEDREFEHKTFTYDLLLKKCGDNLGNDIYFIKDKLIYNTGYPLVDMSTCTNNMLYRYIYKSANINNLNYLLNLKEDIENWRVKLMKMISGYTDKVMLGQRWSSYNLTKQYYGHLWSRIPDGVFD